MARDAKNTRVPNVPKKHILVVANLKKKKGFISMSLSKYIERETLKGT